MNTVPFDQLGPSQSGRLAYQVLGQNGPIFNPQNIRYLSPDSLEIPANAISTGASGMFAGLAGANLIGSIVTLANSAYIAHRINSLHRKIDHLQETMIRIERKINYIVEKVDRIDTQVAEQGLQGALEYRLKQAVSPEEINLRVLTDLRGDINKFTNSLSSPLILNFGLQLFSNTRDQLRRIYDLIYGIRMLVAQRYNTSVDGDPERAITVNPTGDYFSNYGGVDLEVHVRATLNLSAAVIKKIGWINFDDYLPRGRSKQKPHQSIFKGEDPEQGLYDLGYAWLQQADAGLLWRTKVELDAIINGYENTFWPELKEADPCGFNQIVVACDIPLLENA